MLICLVSWFAICCEFGLRVAAADDCGLLLGMCIRVLLAVLVGWLFYSCWF